MSGHSRLPREESTPAATPFLRDPLVLVLVPGGDGRLDAQGLAISFEPTTLVGRHTAVREELIESHKRGLIDWRPDEGDGVGKRSKITDAGLVAVGSPIEPST